MSPYIVFVGAAIATKMATEIWADFESRVLSNAANLTNEDQVASVCRWLVNVNPLETDGSRSEKRYPLKRPSARKLKDSEEQTELF
jgi:Restriction endonuclease BsobI